MSFSIKRIKMSLITSYVRLYFQLFFEHNGSNPNITDYTKFEILCVPQGMQKRLLVNDNTRIYKMIPENCKNLFNNIKHFYEYRYLCYPNTFSMKEMFDILTMTDSKFREKKPITIVGVIDEDEMNNDFYLVVYSILGYVTICIKKFIFLTTIENTLPIDVSVENENNVNLQTFWISLYNDDKGNIESILSSIDNVTENSGIIIGIYDKTDRIKFSIAGMDYWLELTNLSERESQAFKFTHETENGKVSLQFSAMLEYFH